VVTTINMLIALNQEPNGLTNAKKQEEQITPLIDNQFTLALQKKLEANYRLKYHLYPLQMLEIDIKEKITSGKTREQAITELYEENEKKKTLTDQTINKRDEK
jgi:hypothetical protein